MFGICGVFAYFDSTAFLANASSIDSSVWSGQLDNQTYKDSSGNEITKSSLTVLDWWEDTTTNAYYIRSATGLAYFANQVNSGTKYSNVTIYLEGNIDWNGGDWLAISSDFAGTFNGQGYYIYNLSYVANSDYIGFFAGLSSSASVTNLHLRNISVKSGQSALYVGGISGNNGKISNCSVTGSLEIRYGSANGSTLTAYVGGIIGGTSSSSTISYSYSDVDISFSNTSSSGTITAAVGGVVGGALSSTLEISYSFSEGDLYAYSSNVQIGGIVGRIDSATVTISNVYNLGDITYNSDGTTQVGGIIGSIYASSAVVELSYFYDTSENQISIIGNNSGRLTMRNGFSLNGSVGESGNNVYDSSTLTKLSTLARTREFYYSSAGYFSADWNFTSIWSISSSVNGGLPYIEISGNADNDIDVTGTTSYWEGEGTVDSPYIIKTAGDLAAMATFYNNGEARSGTIYYFSLQNDIDLIGKTWEPIGTSSNRFKGVFDGNNHTISGLTCSLQQDFGYTGLFGYTEGAIIKNLIIENFSYIGTSTSSVQGALISSASSTYLINVVDNSGMDVNTVGAGSVSVFYGKNNISGSTINKSITGTITTTGYDITVTSSRGTFYNSSSEAYTGEYHILMKNDYEVVSLTNDSTFGKNLPIGLEGVGTCDVLLYDSISYELTGYEIIDTSITFAEVDEESATIVISSESQAITAVKNGVEAVWYVEDKTVYLTVYYNVYEKTNFSVNGSINTSAAYVNSYVYTYDQDSKTFTPIEGRDGSYLRFRLDDNGYIYVQFELAWGESLNNYSYIFEELYYDTDTSYTLRGGDFSIEGFYSSASFDSDTLVTSLTSNTGYVDSTFTLETLYAKWQGNDVNEETYSININFVSENSSNVYNAVSSITFSKFVNEIEYKTSMDSLSASSVSFSYSTYYSDSIEKYLSVGFTLNDGFTLNNVSITYSSTEDSNFGLINGYSGASDVTLDNITTAANKLYRLTGNVTITVELSSLTYTDSLYIGENVVFAVGPYATMTVSNSSSNVEINRGNDGFIDVLAILNEDGTKNYDGEYYIGIDMINNMLITSYGGIDAVDIENLLRLNVDQNDYYLLRFNNDGVYTYYYFIYDSDENVVTLYSSTEQIDSVSSYTEIMNYELSYDNYSSSDQNGSMSYTAGSSFIIITSTESEDQSFANVGYSGSNSQISTGTNGSISADTVYGDSGSIYKYLITLQNIVYGSSYYSNKVEAIAQYDKAVFDIEFEYVDVDNTPDNFTSNLPTLSDSRISVSITSDSSFSFTVTDSSYYKFNLNAYGGLTLYSAGSTTNYNIKIQITSGSSSSTSYESSFNAYAYSTYISNYSISNGEIRIVYTSSLIAGHYTITLVCTDVTYSINYATKFVNYSDIQGATSSTALTDLGLSDENDEESNLLSVYLDENKETKYETSEVYENNKVETYYSSYGDQYGTEIIEKSFTGTTTLNLTDQIYLSLGEQNGYIFYGFYIRGSNYRQLLTGVSEDYLDGRTFLSLYSSTSLGVSDTTLGSGGSNYEGVDEQVTIFAIYLKQQVTVQLSDDVVIADKDGEDVNVDTTASDLNISFYFSNIDNSTSVSNNIYSYYYSVLTGADNFYISMGGINANGYYLAGYRIVDANGNAIEVNGNNGTIEFIDDEVSGYYYNAFETGTVDMSWVQSYIANGNIDRAERSMAMYIVPVIKQKTVTLTFHSGTGENNTYGDGLDGTVYDTNGNLTTNKVYTYGVVLYFGQNVNSNSTILYINEIIPSEETSLTLEELFSTRTGYTKASVDYWQWVAINGAGDDGIDESVSDSLGFDTFDLSSTSYFVLESTTIELHFYLIWNANSYSVHYDANTDGLYGTATGTTIDQSVYYDQEFQLSTNGFSLSGYEFKGWSTTPDGEVEYEDEAIVKNLGGETYNDSVTLYAVWEVLTYIVEINANGGTITDSDADGTTTTLDDDGTTATYQMIYYTTFEELLAYYNGKISREGFTLDGLYVVSGNTFTQITDETSLTVDLLSVDLNSTPVVTIYARWIYNDGISLIINNTSPLENLTYSGVTQNVDVTDYFFVGNYEEQNLIISTDGALSFSSTLDSVSVTFDLTALSDGVGIYISENSTIFTVLNAGTYSVQFTLTVTDSANPTNALNLGTLYQISYILYITVDKADLTFVLTDAQYEMLYVLNAQTLITPFLDSENANKLSAVTSLQGLASFAKSLDEEDDFLNADNTSASNLEIYQYLMVKYYLLLHTNSGTEHITYKEWQYADYLAYCEENSSEVEDILYNVRYFAFFDYSNLSTSIDVSAYASIFSYLYGVNGETLAISSVSITSPLDNNLYARNNYDLRVYLTSSEALNNYNYSTIDEIAYVVVDTGAYILPQVLSLTNYNTNNTVYYSSSYSTREYTYIGSESESAITISNVSGYYAVGTWGEYIIYVRMNIYTSNAGSPTEDTIYTFNSLNNYLYLDDVGVRVDIGQYYMDYASYFKVVLDDSITFTILNIQDVAEVSVTAQYLTMTDNIQYITDVAENYATELISITAVHYDLDDGNGIQTVNKATIQDVNGAYSVNGTVIFQVNMNDDNSVSLYVNKIVTGVEFSANKTSFDSPSYSVSNNNFISLYKWVEGEYTSYGVDGTMISGDTLSISFDWGDGVQDNSTSNSAYKTEVVVDQTDEELATVEFYAVYTDMVRVEFSYNYPSSYTPSNSSDEAYIVLGQTTVDTFNYPNEPGFGDCVLTPTNTYAGLTFEEMFKGVNGEFVGVSSYSSTYYAIITLDVKWTLDDEISAIQNLYDGIYAVASLTSLSVADVVTILNSNTDLYEYTYRWYKLNGDNYELVVESTMLTFENSGSLDDDGSYRLEIVQTVREEFLISLADVTNTSLSINFDFTLTFMINLVESISISSETEVTYNTLDRISSWYVDISYFMYNNEIEGYLDIAYSLSLGYSESGNVYFEVYLNNEKVTSMINAGTYTIRIYIDSSIYDTSSAILDDKITYNEVGGYWQFTYTILPYTLDISAENLNSSKVFNGYETELTVQISTPNEVVTVSLTRDDGEDVGEYDVYISEVQSNDNYVIVYNGQTLYENGLTEVGKTTTVGTFTITASGVLKLSYTISDEQPEVATVDYDASGYTLELTNDLNLVIKNGNGDVMYKFELTLYDVSRGLEVTDEEILEIIKKNISLVTAQFYYGQTFTTATNSGTYTYQFNIGEFSKYFSSVEMDSTYQFTISGIVIDVSSIEFTKVYDGTTTDIVETDYEGIYISVVYSSAHAGDRTVSLTLQGDNGVDTTSYTLSSTIATGTITKLDVQLLISMTSDSYVYGDVSTSNLSNLIDVFKITTSDDTDYTSHLTSGYYSISYSLDSSALTNSRGYVYVGTYSLVVNCEFTDFNITNLDELNITFEITQLEIEASLSESIFTITTADEVAEYYELVQSVTETGDSLTLQFYVLYNGNRVTAGTKLDAGQYNVALVTDEFENGSIKVIVQPDNKAFYVALATRTLYISFADEDLDKFTQSYNATAYVFSVDTDTNELVITNGDREIRIDLILTNSEGDVVENVEFSYITIQSTSDSGSGLTNAGSYLLVLDASTEQYTTIVFTSDFTTLTFTISRAVIDVSQLTLEKDYDGSDTLTLTEYSNGTSIGFGSDNVSVLARFSTSNAGTGLDVSLYIQGTSASNYTLSESTTTGTINRISAEIKLNQTEFTYGDISGISNWYLSVLTVEADEEIVPDSRYSLTVTITDATYSESGYLQVKYDADNVVTSYTITIVADSTNYNIETYVGTITINPYTIEIIFTYDGQVSAQYGTVTGYEVPYSIIPDLNELVEITLIRDSDSEEVGYYHILSGKSENGNYSVTVSEADTVINGAFQITKQNSRLYVMFEESTDTSNDGDYPKATFAYNGNSYDSVRIEQNGNVWQLIIYSSTDSLVYMTFNLAFYTYEDGVYTLYTGQVTNLTADLQFLTSGSVKNVGTYQIYASNASSDTNEIRIGKDSTTYAFEIEITQKQLYFKDQMSVDNQTLIENGTLYQTFKNADAIYTFEDASVLLEGIVTGETLSIVITFRESTGEIAFYVTLDELTVEAVLSGDGVSNYNLNYGTVSDPDKAIVGRITRASLVIVINDQSFVYGDYEEGSLVWEYQVDVENFNLEKYLADDRLFVLDVSISNPVYSSTGHLSVGNYSIDAAIFTDDFTISYYLINGNQQDNSIGFTLTIEKKQLSLTETSESLQSIFTKDYDETQTAFIFDDEGNLKFDISGIISEWIEIEFEELVLVTDDVTIVSAEYSTNLPGIQISVTFTISGEDADNYEVLAYSYGIINDVTIYITFVYGDGVQSDVDISGNETISSLSYPFTSTAYLTSNSSSTSTSSLSNFPTSLIRTGYTFTGWIMNFVVSNDAQREFLSSLISSLKLTYTITSNSNGTETYSISVGNDEKTVSFLGALISDSDDVFDEYYYKNHDDITVVFEPTWTLSQQTITIKVVDEDGNYSSYTLAEVEVLLNSESVDTTTSTYTGSFDYGSTITIKVTPENYCFFSAFWVNDSYFNGSTDITAGTEGSSTVLTINSLNEDYEIVIRIAILQVNVVINLSDYDGATIDDSNFSSLGSGQYLWTVDYFTLKEQTMSTLPDVSLYGYQLSSFNVSVAGGTVWEVTKDEFASYSLVDFIMTTSSKEITITLTPTFEAISVSVILDFGYNDYTTVISVKFNETYGSSTNWFEKPTREGYEFVGWYLNGTLVTGETIVSIADEHTLVAEWSIKSYSLEVIISNGQITSSNITFTQTESGYLASSVEYGTEVTFVITAVDGYVISSDWDNEAFDVSVGSEGTTATVTFTIPASNTSVTAVINARINEVTYSGEHLSSVQVFDITDTETEIEISNRTFTIETGRTIKFVVSSSRGYDITTNVSITSESAVVQSAIIDEDGNLIVIISGFTSDFEVVFETTESEYQIEIVFDNADSVDTIYIDGATYSVENGSLSLTVVGSSFTFYVQFATGYEFDESEFDCELYVVATPTYVESGTYAGCYEFVVSEIYEDGQIEVTSKLITVRITLEVISYNENYQSVEISGNKVYVDGNESYADVDYGTTVTLTYIMSTNYSFTGWSLNGTTVSWYDDILEYVVTSDITIYAIFSYSASLYNITLSTLKTSDIYTSDGGTETVFEEITGGSFVDTSGEAITSFEIRYGEDKTVVFSVASGYRYYGFGYYDGDTFVYLNREDRTETDVTITISTLDFGEEKIEKLYFVITSYSLTVSFETNIIIEGTPYEDFGVGKIQLSDSDGNVASNGYVVGTGIRLVSSESDGNIEVLAYTGDSIYVRIEPINAGYTLNSVKPNRDDVTATLVYSGDGYDVYEISGLVGNMQGVTITVYFNPNTNYVDISFVSSDEEVDGGMFKITTTDSKYSVYTSGNNGSTITVSAYSDSAFEVVAYIKAGFIGSSLTLVDSDGIVVEGSAVYESLSIRQTGYSGKITFKVSGYAGRNSIQIILEPETYTVNIKDGNVTLVTIYNVAFNSLLDLSQSNSENIVIHDDRIKYSGGRLDLVLTESGYNFQGYFTYPSGAGVQYIDSSGNVVAKWAESGYEYNTITNTFELAGNAGVGDYGIEISLYIYQSYLKTRITFEFEPSIITSITAQDMISGTDWSNSWYYSTGQYYIEVAYYTNITITAPEIEGYTFYKFVISQKTGSGTWLSDVVSYSSSVPWSTNESDDIVECVIQVVYYAQVDVQVRGGEATYVITQDGADDSQAKVLLSQGYVDTTKSFTIEAQASDGYTFVGWTNVTTGISSSNSTQVLSTDKKLTLLLYVEGNVVTLDFSEYDTQNGQIVYVEITSPTGETTETSLGTYVSGQFEKVEQLAVKVGDQLRFAVAVDDGYAIIWNREDITYDGYEDGYNFFILTITSDMESQVIYITPYFQDQIYAVYISQGFAEDEINSNATDSNNVSLAGYVLYDGKQVSFFTVSKDSSISIQVVVNTRYEISQIVISNNGMIYDNLEDFYIDGAIVLSQEYLTENNFSGTIGIEIVYSRSMWENQDVSTDAFTGSGTEDDPYYINTVEDLILMMKLCNSGETNSSGIRYRDCSYMLMNNLDLSEKFWTPIGTEENPFNGTFDFNRHTSILGTVYLAEFYSVTYYNGLFGVLGTDASITTGKTSIWWVYLIIAIILLLILIMVLIYLNARKRKKIREKLAKK